LSVPRWYLWEGGFVLAARAQGAVPTHAHHAIQVVIALEGLVSISGGGAGWRESRGIIVQPDVEHAFDCNGALGVMLFVDPESTEGVWLCSALHQGITDVPPARLDSVVAEFRAFVERPDDAADIAGRVRRCVHGLRSGPAPKRRLDDRVTTVLDTIRSSDDLRISLDRAAAMACLSPSRFAHLFREQVGLPFSRYMLWRKLTRAMVAITSERTIAAAAHAADFADAAHLTRTFYQMFGMAPSVLMQGEFVEIASPFGIGTAE
jgi:AraC family transcriptional regulator